jgi:hypothetical protein
MPIESKKLEQKFAEGFFIFLPEVFQRIYVVCERAFSSILGWKFHMRSLMKSWKDRRRAALQEVDNHAYPSIGA